MRELKIGVSTCPNDTYIFGAALREDIKVPFKIRAVMDDIQLLNDLAIKGALDVIKVSFGVYPKIAHKYKILRRGGALGFGCGPLLLSKKYRSTQELEGKRIAIPGRDTTAFMIFRKYFPECAENILELRFDKIMPAVAEGKADAGLVIHEGRFTYENYGLKKIADMGSLWEEKFRSPIPLGFIAIKKDILSLGDEINEIILASMLFARRNPEAAYAFAEKYAQDMDRKVMEAHVSLYVNDYSTDMTPASKAISLLLGTGPSVFV